MSVRVAMSRHNPLFSVRRSYYSHPKSKHYDPNSHRRRADSIIKIDLPSYEKRSKELSLDFASRREFLKKEGLPQDVSFNYLPINISSTAEVMERLELTENDGYSSPISKGNVLTRGFLDVKARGLNMRHQRKIREFDESFDQSYFCTLAKDKYVDAHNALISRDSDRLHDLVTEFCYVPMVSSIERKSLVWKWVSSLEPPRVVQIRTGQMMSKQMVFGQITVRFFYKQVVALFDRFGRLLYGDPHLERDSLEYVTFERLLLNPYSTWRVHDKTCPRWVHEASEHWHSRTFICPDALPEHEDTEADGEKDETKLTQDLVEMHT